MAGLAETCSHVGALLHWVDTAVRIRDEISSTSKKNEWMMSTPVTDLPYLRLRDINQKGVVPSQMHQLQFVALIALPRVFQVWKNWRVCTRS